MREAPTYTRQACMPNPWIGMFDYEVFPTIRLAFEGYHWVAVSNIPNLGEIRTAMDTIPRFIRPELAKASVDSILIRYGCQLLETESEFQKAMLLS